MGDKNTIELNGKRYDSLTGALLDSPKDATKYAARKTGQSLDSVIGKVQKPLGGASKLKPGSRAINSHKPHKPEPTKTLMRASLKKPSLKPKAMGHLQVSKSQLPSKLAATLPAAARSLVNERRMALAKQVNKSRFINRFQSTDSVITKQVRPLAVKQPAPHVHAAPPTHRPKPKDDIFTIGLAEATSHQQKLAPSKHSERSGKHYKLQRNISILVGVVIILSLVGVFLLKNLAYIDLKIAAERSGVAATIPSSLPAGYKASTPISYVGDSVTITFKAPGSQHFTLIEQNSSWDSQTLRDSFVAVTDPSYQTLQDQGRTIYVYSHGGASWVNNGLWYQISNNSLLSSDQILKLATSL